MHTATNDSSYPRKFRFTLPAVILMLSGFLMPVAGQAADSVGVIKFARGEVSIKSVDGKSRKAQKNEDLMVNELVATGASGIAVIELKDDSRMTLRPQSEFRVTELIVADENSDSNVQSAVLNLLRGGLRLVTGLIGKANPEGYRLNTPVATIGIRGTEFNSRLCGSDCAAEEEKLADSSAAKKIKEGLYVNVDDGRIYMQNFGASQPLKLKKGESGYVSDLNSAPLKLSYIPAFQLLDKIPSPSALDFGDIDADFDDFEFPDDDSGSSESSDTSTEAAAVAATGTTGNEVQMTAVNIEGEWETDDIDYARDIPRNAQRLFFGGDADLEFEFTQRGNKFQGEFDGDREGTIKGEIDENKITFTFVLEAKGGELKEGAGHWIMQDDGTMEGIFEIRDREYGIVEGEWILERDD